MTATQIKTEEKAAELLVRIQNGEKFNENSDGTYGIKLGNLLRQAGYKSYSTGSRCSVASYEDHLEYKGTKVGIIISNLFGNFTKVSVM
jgi:hypothetical protein